MARIIYGVLGVTLLMFTVHEAASIERRASFDPSQTPIQLYYPVDDNMMECGRSNPFPSDTQVEWLVNGKVVTTQPLTAGQAHVYMSLDQLIDIFGTWPGTVQCRIAGTDLESNLIAWVG